MFNKIADTTKVRYWVDTINRIIDYLTLTNYEWKTFSKTGKSVYEFEGKMFPSNSRFSVLYGGIELDEDDYTILGNKLTFVNGAAMEDDYPIVVRYLGNKMN